MSRFTYQFWEGGTVYVIARCRVSHKSPDHDHASAVCSNFPGTSVAANHILSDKVKNRKFEVASDLDEEGDQWLVVSIELN